MTKREETKIALYKILVVDDDDTILELLKYNLERQGYIVKTASNGRMAIERVVSFSPDLILLDIMMPDIDGIETCHLLRAMPMMKDTYIVFLTARSEEYSEVAAFDAGADDFIAKPIKPRALISRISALFKRGRKESEKSYQIKVGNLVIDKSSYTLRVGEKEISLPKKEFELIYFLAKNPNKVFSRDDLLRNIWGVEVYVLARTIDVHIRKLREKIGDHYIVTIKGVGYKLNLT